MNPDKHHAFRPRRVTSANLPNGSPEFMDRDFTFMDRDFTPCDVCGGSRTDILRHETPVIRERRLVGYYREDGKQVPVYERSGPIIPRRKAPTAAVLAVLEAVAP